MKFSKKFNSILTIFKKAIFSKINKTFHSTSFTPSLTSSSSEKINLDFYSETVSSTTSDPHSNSETTSFGSQQHKIDLNRLQFVIGFEGRQRTSQTSILNSINLDSYMSEVDSKTTPPKPPP
ncbi:hypothetical protein ABFS82_01G101500 [Erythranthe guttata]